MAGKAESEVITVPSDSERTVSTILGTGEMADLTRAFDWSTTPLGSIDCWPELLVSYVNTILASRHPMFLMWSDHLIQFYNDAYRRSLGTDGKHPHALGQRAFRVLA
jgi:hypothetical protein